MIIYVVYDYDGSETNSIESVNSIWDVETFKTVYMNYVDKNSKKKWGQWYWEKFYYVIKMELNKTEEDNDYVYMRVYVEDAERL